jgi:hypothetical protein
MATILIRDFCRLVLGRWRRLRLFLEQYLRHESLHFDPRPERRRLSRCHMLDTTHDTPLCGIGLSPELHHKCPVNGQR